MPIKSFHIFSKILVSILLFYFLGAFTQSTSIIGWSVAHNAYWWATSNRIIPSTRIMRDAKRARRCCWNQVRKCNIYRLNNHTSNFCLGTRVDKPDRPNSSDGNDQMIEIRARRSGSYLYLTTRDIITCVEQGFPNSPMSMLHMIRKIYILKFYTFCMCIFFYHRMYIM